MDRKAPGWSDKMKEFEKRYGMRSSHDYSVALREFHAKESAAAVQFVYKAEYLAYRTFESNTSAIPAFSREQLLTTVEQWKDTDGWKRGSTADALMIRNLFPPTGPDALEKKILLRMLRAEPGHGVWAILKDSEFSLTYNGSAEEKRWMNADLAVVFREKPEDDPRYGPLIRMLHENLDTTRRSHEGDFFKPIADERGLWTEISIGEAGILPWLHTQKPSDTLHGMIGYRKIIESPALTNSLSMKRAQAALDEVESGPKDTDRLETALQWLKGLLPF